MLGGLILSLWWKKGRALPVIAGMASSLAVMIFISVSKEKLKVDWPWFTLIGTIVTILIAWLVSLVCARITPVKRPVTTE
jgi:Na+/proline symporter